MKPRNITYHRSLHCLPQICAAIKNDEVSATLVTIFSGYTIPEGFTAAASFSIVPAVFHDDTVRSGDSWICERGCEIFQDARKSLNFVVLLVGQRDGRSSAGSSAKTVDDSELSDFEIAINFTPHVRAMTVRQAERTL